MHYKDQLGGGLDVFDRAESSILRAQGQFPNVDRREIELLTSYSGSTSRTPENRV